MGTLFWSVCELHARKRLWYSAACGFLPAFSLTLDISSARFSTSFSQYPRQTTIHPPKFRWAKTGQLDRIRCRLYRLEVMISHFKMLQAMGNTTSTTLPKDDREISTATIITMRITTTITTTKMYIPPSQRTRCERVANAF